MRSGCRSLCPNIKPLSHFSWILFTLLPLFLLPPTDEWNSGGISVIHPGTAGADWYLQGEEPSGADRVTEAPEGERTGTGQVPVGCTEPEGRGTVCCYCVASQLCRLFMLTQLLWWVVRLRPSLVRPSQPSARDELLFLLTQFVHSHPHHPLLSQSVVITLEFLLPTTLPKPKQSNKVKSGNWVEIHICIFIKLGCTSHGNENRHVMNSLEIS